MISVFAVVMPVSAVTINLDNSMTTPQINTAIAGASSGDTVQFEAGTYALSEPLVAGVAGVILQGDTSDPSNVVIDASGISGDDRDCFQVLEDDVTIRGFKMQNAISQYGPPSWWDGGQNAGIMVGNDGGWWGGTLMDRTDGPTRAYNGIFSNNIIDNCGYGIYLYESNGHTISNNVITGSSTENFVYAGVGVQLFSEHESHLDFTNIQILNNIIADSARAGIVTWQEVDYVVNDVDLTGVVIDGNELYGNGFDADVVLEDGIGGWAIGLFLVTGTPTISNNDIHDNTHGIASAGSNLGPGHAVRFNNIYGNSRGITMDRNGGWPHSDGYIMNAQYNWWGDPSGPSHSTNPGGTGDAVSDNIDYDPWLTFIDGLSEKVLVLGLPKGIENSFVVKLNAALNAFDRGDYEASKNLLGAFINQVMAQSGKKIATGDAELLIKWAEVLIDYISTFL